MNLNDLVDNASEIDSQIEGINKLKQEKARIEKEIFKRLVEEGERFDNPVLDYCFSLGFSGKSRFDILHYINSFFQTIEEKKERPILTMDGEIPGETGIISDKCILRIKKLGEFNHRELYVPVRKVQVFDLSKNKWETWERTDIFITPDIFLHPNKTSPNTSLYGRAWQTDYSDDFFAGGKPKEKTIYVGRTPFQENQDVKIKKEIIVPKPSYF